MRIFYAVIISLLVHLVLWTGLLSVPQDWVIRRQLSDLAEVELLDADDERLEAHRLMVRETVVPRPQDESDEPARFVSRSRQRVIAETQARETGLTQNNPSAPAARSWLRERESQQRQNRPNARALAESIALDGITPVPRPRREEETADWMNFRPSTVGERLPEDVSLGSITALNTDQFRFYSFFSRIEELVRFRWEEGLRRSIEAYSRQPVRSQGRGPWTTRVQFTLAEDGRLLSSRILQESGLQRFDLAAIQAFRDAAVFPNPPKELVSKDGTIKIDYAFSVQWDPRSLVSR